MSEQLTPVSQEILPALTRAQVDEVEGKAVKLYAASQRTSMQFAMELRQLQDGAAHLIRGYPNFGTYVERTFEGVSATNAQQISRMGNVLLILERNGRIDAYRKPDDMPGATGVRALATILGQFGEDSMVAVYDKAASTGRKVLEQNVKAALMEVVSIEPLELGEGSTEPDQTDIDEDDDDGYTETASEILDRIDNVRDCLSDLSDSIQEGRKDRMEKARSSLIEEIDLLKKEIDDDTDIEWLEKGR